MPKIVIMNRTAFCPLFASIPAIVPPSRAQSVAFQIEVSKFPSGLGTSDKIKPRMRQSATVTMENAMMRAKVPLTSKLWK